MAQEPVYPYTPDARSYSRYSYHLPPDIYLQHPTPDIYKTPNVPLLWRHRPFYYDVTNPATMTPVKGTNEDIAQFCSLKYNVTFPIMDKVDVNGHDVAPIYKFLKEAQPGIFWTTRV